MAMRLGNITFDCDDALAQAHFWATVLGWDVSPDSNPNFAIIGGLNRPREAPNLLFLKVPESKAAKNRVHIDLDTDDLAVAVDSLVSLGATTVHEKHEYGVRWITLLDPEGNEFCVADHGAADADAESEAS